MIPSSASHFSEKSMFGAGRGWRTRGHCKRTLRLFILVALWAAAAHAESNRCAGEARLGLPPRPTATSRASDEQAIPLGKRVFFDTRFSADGKMSCGKCHLPDLASSDGRPRAIGHDGAVGTRNTPSLLNVAYSSTLFWDGRASSLESQALAPLTNPREHALVSSAAVAAIVRSDDVYTRDFSAAFNVAPERITGEMVGQALAAYERTLIAGGSAFDRFEYGHQVEALSAAQARGLELFRGRAQCAGCHLIGSSFAVFTDEQFHMSPGGLPSPVTTHLASLTRKVLESASNRGQLEQLVASDVDIAALGRFVVTRAPADIGKFRTPSLRNVALTAPYMHDGSVRTLEEAVDAELYSRTTSMRYPIALTVSERQDLVEFLRSLTGACAMGQNSAKRAATH
jgi:cytochrome c peroxidase